MQHPIMINFHPLKRSFILFSAVFICWTLSAQNFKELFILHTNDTHSCIEPISSMNPNPELAGKGGYLRRATFVKEKRKEYPELLLFDCGDFSQGSPYYNLFRGEVEIRLMNEMGYDAGTIGNHEFDFGIDNMVRLFKMADFPIVCANYDFKGTHLEGIVKPYTIIERDGLKIGVFGLSPKLEGLVQSSNYDGIVYNDPNEAANRIADLLKNKERCDVVICLSHLGWKAAANNPACDEDLIANTRNIDLVLGGHSHSLFDKMLFYKNPDGKEIPLQQMGKNGIFIGTVKLNLKEK